MTPNLGKGEELRAGIDNLLGSSVKAKINQAKNLHKDGQLAQAQRMYEQLLDIEPNNTHALLLLGALSYQTRNLHHACELFSKVIYLDPNNAVAYAHLGVVFNALKQHQAAIDSYGKAIALRPDYADVYSNRGNALSDLKQHQAAVGSYDKAIALMPDLVEAHYNRGNALSELKNHQAAVDSYNKAIALNPDFAKAHHNRGDALSNLKQYQAAIDSYDKAISIWADYAEAHYNRGNVLNALRQYEAAVGSYKKATIIKPDYVDAYYNCGVALYCSKQYQAAIDSYSKALAIDAGYEFLRGRQLSTKMEICDWNDLEDQVMELTDKIHHNKKATPSFSVLAISPSLPLQRQAAEIWVNAKYPANPELGPIQKHARGEKIRLGYFSMDFCNHPVSVLTAELFELHDRERFEVYAFSYGPETKDEMRIRLEAAFDKFIDVKDKSDKEIAVLARQMQIDIAIDLAGFTGDARTEIFALRAAPVQVNYLGYPGTMGANYIDYLIADKQLIPEESKAHYAEKIVYLPCFQANDSKRKIADKVFSREELGLPETGLVFCCFNNTYKITPSTFDSWMRILKQVQGSVLWLLEDNPTAAENLRKEAQHRGMNPERLVFAKRVPLPEYLARYRAADLFLDTFPFNAGTTASDALWAGLPIMTCEGEAFASRMASSLLSAIELPELITTTQQDYEALAVQLASDPEQLRTIRQKLEHNRLSTLLFDTKLFTRNIEQAYTRMIKCYQADLAPEHVCVGPSNQTFCATHL